LDLDDSNDGPDDDVDQEQEFCWLRSGQNVPIGDDGGFNTSRSGRQIISPDKFGQSANITVREQANAPLLNTKYRDNGFPGENMSAYKSG
jgi:hypothetical protein